MKPIHSDPADLVGASLNTDPVLYARIVWDKFVARWILVLITGIVCPLIALLVVHQLPVNYEASAQILVRQIDPRSSLMGDFSAPLTSLSASTSAEILRSEPVVREVVKNLEITGDDIAQPAYRILFSKAYSIIKPLLGREYGYAELEANPDLIYTLLAKDLKDSIEANTLLKEATISASTDDIIDVSVKSPNRDIVAIITNALCERFVLHSNSLAIEETQRAIEQLALQIDGYQAELQEIQDSTFFLPQFSGREFGSASSQSSSYASSLGQTISSLELRLVHLRKTYLEGADEIEAAEAELKLAHERLAQQEEIEAIREMLNELNSQVDALEVTRSMLEQGNGPTSIVERAVAPKKTKVVFLMHYGIPAAAGFVGGIGIGAFFILLLSLLDPRIVVPYDAEATTNLEILGKIGSKEPILDFQNVATYPNEASATCMQRILGRMESTDSGLPRVISITSPHREFAVAEVSLHLASLIGKGIHNRTLLIDANFNTPRLSEHYQDSKLPGILEYLSDRSSFEEVVCKTELDGLDFLPCGDANLRDLGSSNSEGWQKLIHEFSKNYKHLIICTGGVIDSREATPICRLSDVSILVVESKKSSKLGLAESTQQIDNLGLNSLGVVFCKLKYA